MHVFSALKMLPSENAFCYFYLKIFFSSFFPNESSPVSTSIVPTAIATSYV